MILCLITNGKVVVNPGPAKSWQYKYWLMTEWNVLTPSYLVYIATKNSQTSNSTPSLPCLCDCSSICFYCMEVKEGWLPPTTGRARLGCRWLGMVSLTGYWYPRQISKCLGSLSAAVPFLQEPQLSLTARLFLLTPLLIFEPGRSGPARANPCWLPTAGHPPALHLRSTQPRSEVPAAGREGDGRKCQSLLNLSLSDSISV